MLRSAVTAQAAEILSPAPDKGQGAEVAGTAKVVGGDTLVLIDGAEAATPCSTTVGVNDGDRVIVKVKNHRAVIVGNEGSPAVDSKKGAEIEGIARAALESARCIEATDEGLIVGNKDAAGKWVGLRVRIDEDSFDILDAGGGVLASYGAGTIKLGNCEMVSEFGNAWYGLKLKSSRGTIWLTTSGDDLREWLQEQNPSMPGIDNPGFLESSVPGIQVSGFGVEISAPKNSVENGELVTEAVRSISVDGDGVHIDGPLYVNGRLIT